LFVVVTVRDIGRLEPDFFEEPFFFAVIGKITVEKMR